MPHECTATGVSPAAAFPLTRELMNDSDFEFRYITTIILRSFYHDRLMLTLHPATPADAATIALLVQTAFQEYENVLVPPSGARKENTASVLDKMSTGHWLIVESFGHPAGCVFYEVRDDYVYLGRLAVLPEFRGQGIADALPLAVEDAARAANILRVRLGTRLALPQMICMYERRGYRIIANETHAGFSEPTYVTMEKELVGDAASDRTG